MKKIESYRQLLRITEDWDSFLLEESGLPGPRANLELVQAVAEEGDEVLFQRYISYTPEKAPPGSPQEFFPLCGAVGLGRLAAGGRDEYLPLLRDLASDPRWRVREGVAMALQRVGGASMDRLFAALETWTGGNRLEQRAAAAALAEPVLLKDAQAARRVLEILNRITASMEGASDRQSGAFKTLRQGMGYCWSVAVAALPEAGKPYMEKWSRSADRDVRWVMHENLKKNRLARLDSDWAALCLSRLEEKMELFSVSPAWQAAYPGAAAGILGMKGVTNPERHVAFDRRKADLEQALRDRFAGESRDALETLPEIQPYSAYYKRFKKTYHVLLQLESVALKGKPIPQVAALVEAMFMAELQNRLLTAVHDLEALRPPVRLEIALGDERYRLLRGEEQTCKPGDMIMVDGEGVISSVIYGPDQRTRVQPGTERALFAVYAPPGIGAEMVQHHLEDLRNNVLVIAPQAEVEILQVYPSD